MYHENLDFSSPNGSSEKINTEDFHNLSLILLFYKHFVF
jgi:hypothetical protein